MSSTTTTPRVLIVGAGLAGLALAQGLKHLDPPIAFHLSERDLAAHVRSQGYRLRLTPEAAEALRRLLPPHLWDAFEGTCAELIHGGVGVDALTGETLDALKIPGRRGGANGLRKPGGEGRSYSADRAVLRSVLLSGLDEHVSFGKKLESYSVVGGGAVELRFSDGSTEEGDILVGADGVSSAVRSLFLPDFTVLDTEGRAVFGRTHLTPELLERLPKQLGSGLVLISESEGNGPAKLFCESIKFDRSKTTGFEVPSDYVYWVLGFHQDAVTALAEEDVAAAPITPQSLTHLTKDQSAQLSKDMTKRWHESVWAIFEAQDMAATATLAFLTCTGDEFDRKWRAAREDTANPLALAPVTLLGDAAHPLPPAGGVGANAAFREAADLCEAIARIASGSAEGKVGELRAYEECMRTKAQAGVEQGSAGIGFLFPMKPLQDLHPADLRN